MAYKKIYKNPPVLKCIHILFKTLGIILKSLNTIVLWWSEGRQLLPMMPRDTILLVSYASNCCSFWQSGGQIAFLGGHTEKIIFPFPYKLNGIWSWWQCSFRSYSIQFERKWNTSFLNARSILTCFIIWSALTRQFCGYESKTPACDMCSSARQEFFVSAVR